MAAKKSGKKISAGGRAPEGKLKEIREKFGEGIGNGRNHAMVSMRQTRAASAKETADTLDGVSSSPEIVKQSSECAKPGRVRNVKSVQEVLKDGEDDETCTYDLLEKPRTRRACTRSERPISPRNGLIIGARGNEDLEIKENCLPSVAGWYWTEHQEKALVESLSTIKPGVNFWRLIAERVPGRSAEDCFKKFYSERTTTRAAKRSRKEEVDSTLPERNGSKCVGSLETNTPINVKTPGREMRAIRQAAAKGPVKKGSKMCGKGRNAGALTRQTRATSQGPERRIGGASKLPDVEQIRAKKLDNIQKASNNVKVGQRARKGSKNRTGKQGLVEKPEVRASCTLGVALASGFDRSSVSDDGDKEIETPSVFMDSDLWTTVQEVALQDAYSTIKPSANFWFLISNRVPGRSAEECFNKFYSGHPTPPRVVAAQRSCLKEVDGAPSLPNHRHPPKAKTAGGKRLLEAHRTVRNILRRQQVDDEDYEADAFAALEPPDVVHSVMEKAKDDEAATMFDETDTKFSVRDPLPGSTENSTTQCAQSNKENRKPKAIGGERREFGTTTQLQVFSPEILKKVKDPLMLDKYIDHLHQRRTRRPGTKSAQKSAKRASGVQENCPKDGLDFREVRLNAIHRAKQELRDVFLRPGSAVDEPFLDLLNDSTDDDKDDEDDDSVDSQMDL